jgi:hypothetical protein
MSLPDAGDQRVGDQRAAAFTALVVEIDGAASELGASTARLLGHVRREVSARTEATAAYAAVLESTADGTSERAAEAAADLTTLIDKCERVTDRMGEMQLLSQQIKDIGHELGFLEDMADVYLSSESMQDKAERFRRLQDSEVWWRKRLAELQDEYKDRGQGGTGPSLQGQGGGL